MTSARIEMLFASALALPAEERSAYLSRACSRDGDERAQVEELLRAAAHAGAFVKESSTPAACVESIGDYRLLHELGEGGCGMVYLAEQLTPIRREVALKVIKLGMDTKAVINRFEAERQALAMMDHPHIAKVFDAGATPTGRPYFVMELVRGIKITDYAEQCGLTLDERLGLFIQVCQAIQHAHVKGIIHRDIKPSNVLVTLHDGEPIAKVIDFGIAKAMQGRLTEETLFTMVDQFIGTPAYVSPEQTEPGTLGVDTRSDVYSLGVLLYELITGGTPFDNDELLRAGLDTLRKRVRREEPPRPSKRIDARSTRTDRTQREARHAASLARVERVRGDLDWIVMRCLHKDKESRYQSVADLAADLHRFLKKEPISARAPSALYVLRKFAERRRRTVLAASLVLCALLGATIVSTWQAVRATRAEALAQETIDALVSIFDVVDPFASQGTPFSAEELLKSATRTAYQDLGAYPGVQARLLESLGRVMRRRGNAAVGVQLARDAVRLRRSDIELGGPALASALVELAASENAIGEYERMSHSLDEADRLVQRFGLERSQLHGRLLRLRGLRANGLGELATANEYFRASLAIARAVQPPGSLDEAETLTMLSLNHQWGDELEEAERLARAALAIYERKAPPTHPDRLDAELKVAEALQHQGRSIEAAKMFGEALRKTLQVYGSESARTADILDSVSKVELDLGLTAEALAHARDALRISLTANGPQHHTTAYLHTSLATASLAARDYERSRAEALRALEILRATQSADHPYVGSAEIALAEAQLALGDLEAAERTLNTALERSVRTHAQEWRVARLRGAHAEILRRRGQLQEAAPILIDTYRTLAGTPGVPRSAIRRARQRVVDVHVQQGKQRELEQLLASIPERVNVRETLDALARKVSSASSATVPPEPNPSVAH